MKRGDNREHDVSGRSNAASSGRIKCRHFEMKKCRTRTEFEYGKHTQNEQYCFGTRITSAGVV